jgi:hypothetical protein
MYLQITVVDVYNLAIMIGHAINKRAYDVISAFIKIYKNVIDCRH